MTSSITLSQLKNEKDATGIDTDYPEDNSDPKRIGPGYWHCIHTLSIIANTIEKQRSFIETMKNLCEKFPCSVCGKHCKEYIEHNEMEKYIGIFVEIDDVKNYVGLFIWTWKFHNAVNVRTKKKLMSWDTAYNIYNNSKNLHLCSAKCLETEIN